MGSHLPAGGPPRSLRAFALLTSSVAVLILGCAGSKPTPSEPIASPPATKPSAPPSGAPSGEPGAQTGVASFYSEFHDGRRTASGETFDMEELTAAHRTLPFGTRVKVTNLDNGRSVVVRINDRGPFVKKRIIDVSHAAAQQLKMIHRGTARVRLEVLSPAAD
jgi:rare lipoprotein A